MHRIAGICALLFVCPTWPLAAQDTVGVHAVRPSVTTCLNVRVAPEPDAAVVRCLVAGVRVAADSSVPFWRRITMPGGERGWAAKRFLEPLPGVALDADATGPDRWLEIHIVDVGQGDGIWIATPDDGVAGNGRFDGRNVIIDGGPYGSDASNPMLAYLRERAYEGAVIDALIVTHPHNDHFPGAQGILRHFDVLAYYDPGYPKDGVVYDAFLTLVDRERVDGRPIAIHRGSVDELGALDWGSEIDAAFLYSYPGTPDGLGSGSTLENNASVVLRVQYGDHVFLFMGDAEGKDRDQGAEEARYVERMLLDAYPAAYLKATVLKLAHHGSETSSTLPFIDAVNPDVIIVSSGIKPYGPRYLPDESTLARCCAHNPAVRTYRTDRNDRRGAPTRDAVDRDHIVIRTNGRVLQIIAYDRGAELAEGVARCG
ncbi:MAG: MBL fold metallo-hydrolase [Gemmatimonadales bacterium]|nr:MBL fold metallo-hydrolase [Gemmatimonadales bacterium]